MLVSLINRSSGRIPMKITQTVFRSVSSTLSGDVLYNDPSSEPTTLGLCEVVRLALRLRHWKNSCRGRCAIELSIRAMHEDTGLDLARHRS